MAISQSTSPQPLAAQLSAADSSPPATFEARLLTVGDYLPTERWSPEKRHLPQEPKTPFPFLRLQGRWLDRAGFARGSRVRVNVAQGRLVIEALPKFPEREPHLPR